jgi:hypothetical protein
MPLDAGTKKSRCDVCRTQLAQTQRVTCSRLCSLKKSAERRRGNGKEPYIRIRVNGRRVPLHRYIFETHFRPLSPDEIVHHKNGNKRDNRPENLEAMSRAEHLAEHGYFRNNRFYKYASQAIDRLDEFREFGF